MLIVFDSWDMVWSGLVMVMDGHGMVMVMVRCMSRLAYV